MPPSGISRMIPVAVTPNSACVWIAEATVEGRTYSARSRHRAANELAWQLVAAELLYEQLSRQAILCVKAEHVASFLGHKITPQLAQEIGSRFATRIEGTCVKHRFAKSSIKIYDKFALVLRIETTTNTSPLSSTTAR